MVESIYFLKPAWCGTHPAGLWPEQDLQSVTPATAFQAVVCHSVHASRGKYMRAEPIAALYKQGAHSSRRPVSGAGRSDVLVRAGPV